MLRGSETWAKENFEKRYVICHLHVHTFSSFFIVDIVDGLSISYISFLVTIGNWQKHGMLRGLLSISIDKI